MMSARRSSHRTAEEEEEEEQEEEAPPEFSFLLRVRPGPIRPGLIWPGPIRPGSRLRIGLVHVVEFGGNEETERFFISPTLWTPADRTAKGRFCPDPEEN